MINKFSPLKELCTDVVDCPHSTPKWLREGITVIRNFNIKKGKLNLSDHYCVDEETYANRTSRAIPEYQDLIISREAPMGEVCLVPNNFKCCLGQRLVLLKVDKEKCIPEYLLYALMSNYVQAQIKKVDKTGSIVSNLNIPDLENLSIPIVSKPEQQKIVELLTTIDEKIDANNKIQETNKKYIDEIFAYWFYQYDFPDQNRKPYATSGNPMKFDEELELNIPVDFRKINVGELYNDNVQKISPQEFPKTEYYHYSLPAYDECKSYMIELGGSIKSDKSIVTGNHVLVSKLNPWFNRVLIPEEKEHMIASTEFIVWNSKSVAIRNFLYVVATSKNFIEYCTAKATGTSNSHKRIDPKVMERYSVIANEEIIEEFGKTIQSNIEILQNIKKENRKLFDLKWYLLDLLIVGQIKRK